MKTTIAIAVSITALAMIASGCAAREVSIASHRDGWADFSQFHTFNFRAIPSGIASSRVDADVREHIGSSLVAKGYRYTTAGRPDLVVHYYVAVADRADVRHQRVVYHGRHVTAVGRRAVIDPYRQGRLYVDVYDTATNKLVWRSTADGTARSRDEAKRKTAAALDRVMTSFPTRTR